MWDELMNAAEREFSAGNLDAAKQLYLQVVSGSDDSESRDFVRDGISCVRLLTSSEFIHYVHLMKQSGRNEGLEWVPSVRACALWRLGYICVERREFMDGIVCLERAHRVLPRSAKITIELAFCHGATGNHEIALSLYESIGDVGYHVTAPDKAMSLRGAGAQLADEPSAQHQPVAGDLGIGRSFLEGGQQVLTVAHDRTSEKVWNFGFPLNGNARVNLEK